jgi:hypothetical protein
MKVMLTLDSSHKLDGTMNVQRRVIAQFVQPHYSLRLFSWTDERTYQESLRFLMWSGADVDEKGLVLFGLPRLFPRCFLRRPPAALKLVSLLYSLITTTYNYSVPPPTTHHAVANLPKNRAGTSHPILSQLGPQI